MVVDSDGFQVKNLTISNDLDESSLARQADLRAAALLTQGDQIVFENVRILAYRYTALFQSSDPTVVARTYIKDSHIEGDSQFLTGRGTVVIDNSEIRLVTKRIPRLERETGLRIGSMIAASTAAQNPHGFLVIGSKLTFDPLDDYPVGWALLGRSWDVGADPYVLGVSVNGQVVIRECELASHIRLNSPWGMALPDNADVPLRHFDVMGNRLYEYQNTGPGAA
ncbi:hypothetical protein ACFL5O_07615 [Myxococcota bacterium]